MSKTLDATSEADANAEVGDVVVVGDTDAWRLICKASSASQGWMKSTRAMQVSGGVVLQVSTQQGDHVAEALVFVPNVELEEVATGTWQVRR